MRTGLVGFILFYFTSSLFAQSGDVLGLEQVSDPYLPDSAKIVMMIDLAAEFKNSGSMQESMNLLRRAQSIADSLHSAYLLQKVNLSLSENYLTARKPGVASDLLQETLKSFPNSNQKADILNLLATAYRYQAKYGQSLKAYKKAKALIDSVKNPRTLAAINQNIGVVYGNMGNMALALKHYLAGVEYAEAAKDSLFLSNVLNNLGEVYNSFSQPEKAGFYLERAIEISEKIGFKVGEFRAVSNLANTKKDLGHFGEALSLYKRALSLHKNIRPDTPPYIIIYNMGDMYLRMGNTAQAEKNFKLSLKYCHKLNVPQGIFYNYSGLANVARQRGELSKAIDYWRQAFAVAGELGSMSFQKTATENIYKLHKKLGNFQTALTFHEKYKAVADSIQQMEAEQELTKTEAMLSLRKQEQINHLLKEKHQVQEAKIDARNWLIIVSLGIILVTLLSLLFIYRTKVEKQRINRELELQRNQLQQLNRVKDKMLAIIAHDVRSPMSSMKSMLYLLREDDLSREDVETMWTQLELSISQNISMMDNLLAWAKEQMSGMALNMEIITAREVVKEVFKNYEFKARQKGVLLKNNVAEGLKVEADFNLLQLILRNLVANSIKFTKEGDSITVSTREEKGKIIFDVNDTGIGIPEEEQQHIFTVHGTSREGTDHEKGSGLGLQLCKEFVEKQNGKIVVKSIEGKGTTFSFSLPRAS
ncbi:MAG TPA: tetratricopeptide repeat-containing sensor histidine kinase [Balneolaceae bacterium]